MKNTEELLFDLITKKQNKMKNTEELLTESGSIFKGWEVDIITDNGMNIIRNNRQGKLISVKLHQGKLESIERNVLNVIAAAPEMLEALLTLKDDILHAERTLNDGGQITAEQLNAMFATAREAIGRATGKAA